MYRDSDAWEVLLGEQVRAYRLRQNMSQAEVADRLGLSIGSIARLEKGAGSSLSTFLKVAQLLGKDAWLEAFAPQVSISPLQQLDMGKQRERASRRREL